MRNGQWDIKCKENREDALLRGKEHKECRTHPAVTGEGKGSIKGNIGIWHIKRV